MVASSMATVCRNSVIQLVSRLRAYSVEYDFRYPFVVTTLSCRLEIPCTSMKDQDDKVCIESPLSNTEGV